MEVEPQPEPEPLVQPFPRPRGAVRQAYWELDLACNGTAAQKRSLGNADQLPRPWSPGTCRAAQLREELWEWLDKVVVWINHELVFDPVDFIPSCWPRHADLVNEIAVLADLRRSADLTFSSVALEEWHRNALPAFLGRMRHRVADHCTNGHSTGWPSAGRFNRQLGDLDSSVRTRAFVRDVESVREASPTSEKATAMRNLKSVD